MYPGIFPFSRYRLLLSYPMPLGLYLLPAVRTAMELPGIEPGGPSGDRPIPNHWQLRNAPPLHLFLFNTMLPLPAYAAAPSSSATASFRLSQPTHAPSYIRNQYPAAQWPKYTDSCQQYLREKFHEKHYLSELVPRFHCSTFPPVLFLFLQTLFASFH